MILSTSKDGPSGSGTDELANLGNDKTFVSHIPSPSGATYGAFDDIVIWISPNVLVNRMVTAGKLP